MEDSPPQGCGDPSVLSTLAFTATYPPIGYRQTGLFGSREDTRYSHRLGRLQGLPQPTTSSPPTGPHTFPRPPKAQANRLPLCGFLGVLRSQGDPCARSVPQPTPRPLCCAGGSRARTVPWHLARHAGPRADASERVPSLEDTSLRQRSPLPGCLQVPWSSRRRRPLFSALNNRTRGRCRHRQAGRVEAALPGPDPQRPVEPWPALRHTSHPFWVFFPFSRTQVITCQVLLVDFFSWIQCMTDFLGSSYYYQVTGSCHGSVD